MIDRLEYARVFADSDYDGEKQGRRFALLAIANVLIAYVERMDNNKATKRRESKTQVGKRKMNALEVETMKSAKHKNLRMVSGTRWLVWSKKRNAWVVYGRRRLIVTGDEAEAIECLLQKDD